MLVLTFNVEGMRGLWAHAYRKHVQILGGGLSLNIKLVIRMFKCTENLTFPNILVAYSLLTPSRVHYNSVARHTSIQKEENV